MMSSQVLLSAFLQLWKLLSLSSETPPPKGLGKEQNGILKNHVQFQVSRGSGVDVGNLAKQPLILFF